MKRTLYKWGLIILYLALMFAVLDFDLVLIINIKLFLFVAIGATILSLLSMMNSSDYARIKWRIKVNVMVTSVITAFLSMISALAHTNTLAPIIISDTMLAVLYGFLLILIIEIIPLERYFHKSAKESNSREIMVYGLTGMEKFVKKYELTRREEAILERLLKDDANKEIGEVLFITENTVKKHTQNIYRKTNVKNRTELLQMYLDEHSKGDV
jgi:DNA-binding CsgD family transcriptional regulator